MNDVGAHQNRRRTMDQKNEQDQNDGAGTHRAQAYQEAGKKPDQANADPRARHHSIHG